MKDLNYGDGYRYAHNAESGYTQQDYLPEQLKDRQFYHPVERGYEKIMAERLRFYRQQPQPEEKPEEKNRHEG